MRSGSNFTVVNVGGKDVLISYSTPIAFWDNGLHRLWSGWSRTSMGHIRRAFGKSISKADWESLPLETLELQIQYEPTRAEEARA